MAHPDHPHADGSVRLAVVDDAGAIASVQAQALRVSYAPLLSSDAAESFDLDAAKAGWAASIQAPPTRRHRVLVAIGEPGVVGFAASAPGSDDDLHAEHDAELLALHVSPDHLREGHGSRLMAAIVDHAHDDGFSRLVCWVFAADDPMRSLMREAGWDADGSTRDLDVGELLHQVRLHTSIRDDPHLIA